MNESTTMSDGLEQLLSLEEKINQTIDLLRTTRGEKKDLLRENLRLRHDLEQQNETLRKLEDRLGRLEKEKDTVRVRIQKLLEQVDSLNREKSEA